MHNSIVHISVQHVTTTIIISVHNTVTPKSNNLLQLMLMSDVCIQLQKCSHFQWLVHSVITPSSSRQAALWKRALNVSLRCWSCKQVLGKCDTAVGGLPTGPEVKCTDIASPSSICAASCVTAPLAADAALRSWAFIFDDNKRKRPTAGDDSVWSTDL